MTQALKPCPFCGGEAEIRQTTSTSGYKNIFVLCLNCLTTSNNYSSEKRAADFWNRRNNDD